MASLRKEREDAAKKGLSFTGEEDPEIAVKSKAEPEAKPKKAAKEPIEGGEIEKPVDYDDPKWENEVGRHDEDVFQMNGRVIQPPTTDAYRKDNPNRYVKPLPLEDDKMVGLLYKQNIGEGKALVDATKMYGTAVSSPAVPLVAWMTGTEATEVQAARAAQEAARSALKYGSRAGVAKGFPATGAAGAVGAAAAIPAFALNQFAKNKDFSNQILFQAKMNKEPLPAGSLSSTAMKKLADDLTLFEALYKTGALSNDLAMELYDLRNERTAPDPNQALEDARMDAAKAAMKERM